MFSAKKKKHLANCIESLIIAMDHPEMDNNNVRFKIHIDGKESWSFADITDNNTAAERGIGVNPWNESQDDTAKCVVECLHWYGDILFDKHNRNIVAHFLKGTDAIAFELESAIPTDSHPLKGYKKVKTVLIITTKTIDQEIKFVYREGCTIKKLNGTIIPDGAYKVAGVLVE